MKSIYLVLLAIILMPLIYWTKLPQWLIFIPLAYLLWVWIPLVWVGIKNMFK